MTSQCPMQNTTYVQGAQNAIDGRVILFMSVRQHKIYENVCGRGISDVGCISNDAKTFDLVGNS